MWQSSLQTYLTLSEGVANPLEGKWITAEDAEAAEAIEALLASADTEAVIDFVWAECTREEQIA